ncbi:MAG: M14 family metallocarboxypeptidase [Opitutus sp.]|nr:M14 family metallocarboxypeptidase [Opitutus sp.]
MPSASTTVTAATRTVEGLLEDLHPTLQPETIVEFEHAGARHIVPRLRLAGAAAGHDPIRIGIFAGLHGDEPAGCSALIEFANAIAEEPSLADGFEFFLYPVLNPTGYEQNTRHNANDKDLNREFWRDSDEVEVQAIERELRAHAFAGIITLHADDTCEGVYGYTHGRVLNEALLKPALDAASAFLPVDSRAVIDGFPAQGGLICQCFQGVLSAPREQRPQPFDVIFETPAYASFDLQVSAALAALKAIVARYPGFISYAQDL